jgi:uncharacterized protein YndB with AHSA1/START domain
MSAKPSLIIKRRLGAPPKEVYGAWTDPEKIVHWWGPAQAQTLSAELDPRVGGRFRIVFRTPDHEEHDVSGTYREVIPNRKLVFTWMWRTMPERQSLVTVTLAPDGDGTLLTLQHEQFLDETARDRHRSGWTASLDRLERYVA